MRPVRAGFALCLLLLAGCAWNLTAATVEKEAAAPKNAYANAFKLPDGAARAGWELFLKNDLDGAAKAFSEALAKDGKDLQVLEGLRAVAVARGDYKSSQKYNLLMIEAATEPGQAEIFCSRAQAASFYSESRQALQDLLARLAKVREGALQAVLRDYLASLYLRTDQAEEAQQALNGIGYIDRWQFAAGPFGSKDKNDPFNRRYAPERALKTLDFTDERNEKVQVAKDLPAPHRSLNLSAIFPGAKGVFYAFTNLESDSDQDVILGYAGPQPSVVFLRGMPVLQQPDDEEFQRGAVLVRTHLVKGDNPLLVKLSGAAALTLRVLDLNYAPLKNVRVKPLPAEELAKHEASPLRGIVAARRVVGMTAEYFLRRLPEKDRVRAKWMAALLKDSRLPIGEAGWADQAASHENDPRARLALGRAVAGYAPDSIGALDLAAHIIESAGQQMGSSEAREAEEARRLREHALKIVPGSHQHLLGLYSFFAQHELEDQAFEKIKACAEAHPDSPLALAELASTLQARQFNVEAEKYFEQAAALDEAYLGRLAAFHDSAGNRVRARELRRKQIALGQIDLDGQLEIAFGESDLARAAELLAMLEKAYPERAGNLANLRVRLLVAKNDLPGAYELQKKILEKVPENDEGARRAPLLGLADLALRMNRNDEARALLSGYLKDTPGDFDIRQRLRDLQGGSGNWWEAYDVKTSAIDTSHFTAERYKTANHAWIVDFMATKILPDLSRESYVHIAQKVLTVKGIGELSEVLVQAQRNQIVFIRTLNPDGSSYMPQNVHNFNLAQTASAYKVGPGSILEHAYLEHLDADKDEPALQMGFNFNAIDAPRAVSRWVLLVANEALPKLKIRKIRPELIDEKKLPGPPGYTVFQWTNKQVEGIKFEPLMPGQADQEVIPLVTVETPPQPYHGSAWLARRKPDYLPSEAVAEARRIAAAAKDARDPEGAKFMAIAGWVRDNIQPGQDSRTLDDVWFSRAGNAGQMTTLAREMARSAGLNVRSAFVNQSYLPGKIWKSKNAERQWEPAELANFSSGFLLVMERAKGADCWIQFVGQSPKFYDPRAFNANQNGALALAPGDDGARIKRVNGEAQGFTPTRHHVAVKLDKAGNGAVEGTLALFGNLGGSAREGLSNPQRTHQIKEWVVRSWWPKIRDAEVDVDNESDPSQPLVFAYRGTVERLGANEAGGKIAFTPYLNSPRLLNLRGQNERQNDMLIRAESADFDHTISYTAPEGCGWVEVPDDLLIATEFGWFLSDYNVRGRTLSCTRSYLLPQERITPEKYAQFQSFLNAIAIDQQQRIGYAPLHLESFGGVAEPVFSGGYAGSGD